MESKDWDKPNITKQELILLLENKVNNVDFNKIKEDIIRFIPDSSVLEIWSAQYFKELVYKIKIK